MRYCYIPEDDKYLVIEAFTASSNDEADYAKIIFVRKGDNIILFKPDIKSTMEFTREEMINDVIPNYIPLKYQDMVSFIFKTRQQKIDDILE